MSPILQTSNSITYQLKVVLFLSCLGLLAFYGTLHSPFHYDDAHAIVENPYIKNLSDFQETVGIQNIFNRSVLLFSFALNQHIGELEVFGFHLANILIHILTAIVWYFLVREFIQIEASEKRHLLKKLPLVCSAIHLVNPLSVQTVTYISSRSSLLATFFYLLAFYLFVRAMKTWGGGISKFANILTLAGVLFFLFLGIGTKEIVVTFPLMAVVYLWTVTPGEKKLSLIPKVVSILSVLVVFLTYRYLQQGNIFSLNADPVSGDTSRLLYLLGQIKVIVNYYLLKFLVPFNLNFEPDIVLYERVFNWDWIFSFGFLIIAGYLIFRNKSKIIQFGALWFIVTLLPTSSFIPLKQLATEHRIYLPGLGISLILGWIFLNLRKNLALTRILLITILSLLSLLTINRSLDFRSEISLWEDTAHKSPQKALVHNNLATAYMGINELEKAKVQLEVALSINPLQIDSHVNLGHIAGRQKNWGKAIEKFDLGITLGTEKADTFYFSGLARTYIGKYAEAIPFFQKAIDMKPFKSDYHFDLGNAFRSEKLFDDALNEFRKTLEIQPNHFKAMNNRGAIYWALGALDQAENEFKNALALQPNLPDIHNNLAALYLKRNDFKSAIPHLSKLVILQPENSKAKKLLHFSMGQAGEGTP